MTEQTAKRLETPGIDKLSFRGEWRRVRSLRWPDLKRIFGTIIDNWFVHNVPRMAASLAFYTLLSLAPLLIIVIAIAGAVFGREAATGQLVWQITDLIGEHGAELVQALLQGAQSPSGGLIATVLGLGTLFFGATAVVSELRSALDTIWCVPQKEDANGIRAVMSLLVDRTLSFAMILGIGFLLLVSLAVNAAIAALGDTFHLYMQTPRWALQMIDFAFSYAVFTVLFALLFKVVPDIEIEWGDVALGSALTALLFSVGKTLIGLYLGKAGLASTYGAAGSLVVVLFWVYYSAQIFYFGAEFTQAYAEQFGSQPCDRAKNKPEIITKNKPPAIAENRPQIITTDRS